MAGATPILLGILCALPSTIVVPLDALVSQDTVGTANFLEPLRRLASVLIRVILQTKLPERSADLVGSCARIQFKDLIRIKLFNVPRAVQQQYDWARWEHGVALNGGTTEGGSK